MRVLAFALAIALSLPGRATAVGQEAIPCYYDWSTAPQQNAIVANSPEFNAIVNGCRRRRSDTVSWDQHLQTFEQSLAMNVLQGEAQRRLRTLIEMIRKERDHLKAARTAGPPRAATPPAPTDTNIRALDLGPLINQPLDQPDRFSVNPVFSSWVPKYLREMVAARVQWTGRIRGFDGDATIRRGDRLRRLADIVRPGEVLRLQAGDVFEARNGHIDFDFDGAEYRLYPGGTFGLGFVEQCLSMWEQQGGAPAPRLKGAYLIEGTLLYATTGHGVRGKCVIAVPGKAVSVRGTSFKATNSPVAGGGALDVEVFSGSIVIEAHDTNEMLTIPAGERRAVRYLVPAAPPSTPPRSSSPAPVPSQYAWDVQNNCRYDLDVRLFELNSRDEITGSWKAVPVAAGERTRIPIRPTPGGKVCWGANSRQGNLRWGLGLDGEGTCDRCCSETLAATAGMTRTANLTCPGK